MNEQINEDDAARMTLVEHLVELRRRLIICAIAVVVCSAIMFLLYNRVLHFLSGPYEQVTRGDTSCGGTATGEHGVGMGKRKFMVREHGESLQVMRRIKQMLDPNGILNPGKIFPEE